MNILVTGASRGIGKVIATELQSLGKVFVTARTETDLQVFGFGNYCVGDLADETDLIKIGNFIEENKIDVLVNNAGAYAYQFQHRTRAFAVWPGCIPIYPGRSEVVM